MSRLLVALLLCSIPSLGANGQAITVAQLLSFMRSCIQQKTPDREVAKYVVGMKLSEKLDDRTIEQLQSEGLGQQTVSALKHLAEESANLAPPVPVAPQPKYVPPPPPSYDEQQDYIKDMTEYAMNYTQRLPNFICTQVTRQAADPRFRDSWINYGSVLAKVSYVDGHENYEVKLVNNNVVQNKSMEDIGGSVSTGEFGSTMHEIFDPMSEAEFHFDHWGTLRGKDVVVFNYAIEQSRSKYSILYNRKDRIVTAYKGLVYVDKKTRAITRLTAEAVNIPPEYPVKAATSRVDYDLQTIGPRDFIVPITAEMNIRDGETAFRNKIEFRSYRVFGADTNIRYDEIPPEGDDSKSKETPPK
jgi:hypothetical protein